MDVYQDDIITQEDPKPKPTLAEDHRAKLDSIVQQMIKNKESDDNIHMVVDDFKQKYGQAQPTQQQPKQVSIGLQPNNYQVQISQPSTSQVPTQPQGERTFNYQQSEHGTPIENKPTYELKFQQNALKAHDAIQNELKGNKDIKTDMIKQRRFEQAALNIPISKTDMPKTQAEADVQRLIPQAIKPQELPVTEEDLAKEDADVMADRGKAVRLLEETMKKYPEKSKELQKNIYTVDAANSLAPGQENRLPKIEENAKRIDKGQLVYDARSGRLLRPMGLLDSVIEGWKQDAKNVADYDFLQGANNNDILNEYHNRQKEVDIDKPIPVPKGKLSEIAQMVGGMPLKPLAAGAIGSLGGPEAGGAAATLVGGRENQKREYAGTFWQTLDELIKKGTPENEAVNKARELAGKAGQIGALTGAAMGLTGARMADLPFAKPVLSNSFKQAAFNVLKQSGSTLGKAGLEGLTVGGIGAAGQYYKNKLAQEAGIFRPLDQGLADQLEGGLMMTVAMAAAIKAGRGISKGNYRNLLHGLSKMPDEQIGGMLQNKVQNGEITQKAADETQQRLNDYKAKDTQIPPNVTDEARFKIQDNIDKINELEKQKEVTHKSLQEPIQEKIDKLTKDNLALSQETENPIKPESGLTKDQEKEATEIAEEWLHEGIIPDSYEGAIKKDPIGFWKFLSQQAHNTDENWRPNEGPSPEQGMREDLGDTVVDYAKELFPAPEVKETPKSVSVIQPGEIKHPETVTISPKTEIKPISEQIAPNKEFQTMGMGNDEGKQETKEARTLMKQRMLQGDVPIDGEGGKGETGRGFAGRVLTAWENLKKSGDNNTSLVTHSSVLKAIKTWENPETWKGVEKPSDPTQMNNEQWLKFADEYNKERTENGDLETFKGDKGDIHVIRHGQTEDNKMNKFRSGNTNLTEEGIQQAHEVGKRLQEKTGGNVPQIVSSDLPRAIHTSNIIHENLKPTEDALQKSSTGSLFQHPQEAVGETGSGRSGMEQGQQGEGTTETRTTEENNGTGKEKVEDLSITDAYGLPFIEEAGDKRTGIKNVISKMTRFERKLPEVEVPKLSPDQQVLQEGKDFVDSGKINPLDVVNRILETKGGMEPDEAKAMQYYMYQLGQHETNLREQLAKVTDGSVEHAELNGQIQQLSDEIDAATEANVISGKAWSDVGNIRQIVADTGFNASREKATIKEAYGGKIPEEVQKRLDTVLKERDAALNKLAKLQEQKKQVDAETTIKSQSASKNPKKTAADFKDERTQIKKDISEKLRKGRTGESGLTAVPLPFAKELIQITPDIFKLIKSYAEEGVQKTEEVINRLHDVLKDELNGITKADIVNLLAGRYKAEGENVSAISQRIRDFRTEANLWTKIAEATKMEEDSPQKKELKNKKLQDLKDRLNEIRQRNKETIAEMKDILTSDAQKEVQRLQRQRKGLETQLKNKKYLNNEEKPNVPITNEILKEQQKIINANYKIRVEKRKAFESQKNWYQKTLMWTARGIRLSILSGVKTALLKLSSAATIGGAGKRIPEQALGYINGLIFKGVAEKAPIEGGVYLSSELKFYKEFFNPKKFVKNTWEILKHGQGFLAKKHGTGEHEHIPGLYVMTDMHQIIKDPLKRATYEASFNNTMKWAAKHGLDTNDDFVIQSIENAAFKRANYEVFQESRPLQQKYAEIKRKMEESGNIGATGKFVADAMIPVSTVPTNIGARLLSTSPLGLIRGSIKMREAYRKGIENLSTQEAESVMRQMKQGQLGTMLWMVGWFGFSYFGGLFSKFNPNKERDQGDLKSDEMSVGGEMIPKPVQHALPLEIIQFAATARRVYDHYKDDKDASTFESIEKSGLASIGALTEQIPILETIPHTIGAFNNPYEAKKLEEDVKRRFEPQILRETGVIPSGKTEGSGGGAGASGTYEKPTRTKPEKPHKIHR